MLFVPVRLQIFYLLTISNYQCETIQADVNQCVFQQVQIYTFKINSFLF